MDVLDLNIAVLSKAAHRPIEADKASKARCIIRIDASKELVTQMQQSNSVTHDKGYGIARLT